MQDVLQDLVQRASQGDEDALNLLCRKNTKRIFFYCFKIMGNQHDAEDAMQEVFVKIKKNITTLKEPKAFNAWLNKIILNTCVDLKREFEKKNKNISIEEYEDYLESQNVKEWPSESLESRENLEYLKDAIQALPLKYKKVIMLYYYDNFDRKKIAEELDTTVSSVDHILRRAREKIKKNIERNSGGKISSEDLKVNLSGLVGMPILAKGKQSFIKKINPIKNRIGISQIIINSFVGVIAVATVSVAVLTPKSTSVSAKNMIIENSENIFTKDNLGVLAESSFKTQVTLSGTIYIDGKKVDEFFFPHLKVSIVDMNGKVVSITNAFSDGTYLFNDIEIEPNQEYMIAINSIEKDKEGNPIELQNREIKVYITSESSQALPPIYLKKVADSSLAILFLDGDEISNVNPKKIKVYTSSFLESEIIWEITKEGSSEILATGNELEVDLDNIDLQKNSGLNNYIFRVFSVTETSKKEIQKNIFFLAN